jgi:hypothetical protein
LKIIVDKKNQLEVYDTEGHLMYIWQPVSIYLDIEHMNSDELDAMVTDAIRDSYNK